MFVQDDDFVIIKHNFTKRSDRVYVLDNEDRNETSAINSNSYSGDWAFEEDDTILDYISELLLDLCCSSTEDILPSKQFSCEFDPNKNLGLILCLFTKYFFSLNLFYKVDNEMLIRI